MKKSNYIVKPDKTTPLNFEELQQHALNTVQELSGNVWSDFNVHDPGVTMMDAFNYALTELDYKSKFNFQDYFTSNKHTFAPQIHGLYMPYEIFPSGTNTASDYRKLIYDTLSHIRNVWLQPSPNKDLGCIDILIDTFNNTEHINNQIETKVIELYNAHRNLGEKLNNIYFVSRKQLKISADINIHLSADAEVVFSELYFCCNSYFCNGIRYKSIRQSMERGEDLSSIFDGPLLNDGRIANEDTSPLKTEFSLTEINYLLHQIDGVKEVRNLCLYNDGVLCDDEIIVSDVCHSFTISFPSENEKIIPCILRQNRNISIDRQKSQKLYKQLRVREYGNQTKYNNIKELFDLPKGEYKNLAEYYSIQNDLPACYGTNMSSVPLSYSDERKAQTKQLKAFLLIIDLIMSNTSMILDNIPQLLCVSDDIKDVGFPDLSNSVALWHELIDKKQYDTNPSEDIINLKHAYFDMLDELYDEKSQLSELNDFDYYTLKEDQRIKKLSQRSQILKVLPKITSKRSISHNITDLNIECCSVLKQHFCMMMDIDSRQDSPIINTFSKYSLKLISDKIFFDETHNIFSIDLVIESLEDNFSEECIYSVPITSIETDTNDFEKIKSDIYLLKHNVIFESFLRRGINIKDYKVIQTEENFFLLVYHVQKRKQWIVIGRYHSLQLAIDKANILRSFLISLNKETETLYIVEHVLLFDEPEEKMYNIKVDVEHLNTHFKLEEDITLEQAQDIIQLIKGVKAKRNKIFLRTLSEGAYALCYKLTEDIILYFNRVFSDEYEANKIYNAIEKFHFDKITIIESSSNKKNTLNPATVSVILPCWSARFNNARFQEICEIFLRERIPAHLSINFIWLHVEKLQQFEKLYFDWRKQYAQNKLIKESSQQLIQFLIENL